jgi:hypothetical protein
MSFPMAIKVLTGAIFGSNPTTFSKALSPQGMTPV